MGNVFTVMFTVDATGQASDPALGCELKRALGASLGGSSKTEEQTADH